MLNEDKLYFKCVNNGSQENFPDMSSACQNDSMPESVRVIYKVGEFVKPNLEGSKLFVFESLFDAKYFQATELLYDTKIYSCKVKNPTKPTWKHAVRIPEILEFWESISKGEDYSQYLSGRTLVSGTVLCDEVQLIEKVYEYE